MLFALASSIAIKSANDGILALDAMAEVRGLQSLISAAARVTATMPVLGLRCALERRVTQETSASYRGASTIVHGRDMLAAPMLLSFTLQDVRLGRRTKECKQLSLVTSLFYIELFY